MSNVVDYCVSDVIDIAVPAEYLVQWDIEFGETGREYLGEFFVVSEICMLARRICEKEFASVDPLPEFIDYLLGVMVDPSVCAIDASCDEVMEAIKSWAEGINENVMELLSEKYDAQRDGSWWED